MRKRPILFSGPMVRSLLAGTKTQTRRAVTWRDPTPGLNMAFSGLAVERTWCEGVAEWVLCADTRSSSEWRSKPTPCPYGQPGDRLQVRETFFAWGRWEVRWSEAKDWDEWHFVDMTQETGKAYGYDADRVQPIVQSRRRVGVQGWWRRPAIFMPREASRITLEITGVRVERLQDISEADAVAEGCPGPEADIDSTLPNCPRCGGVGLYTAFNPATGGALPDTDCDLCDTPVKRYRLLWESINGTGSWAANPFVWVIEFRRMEAAAA